MTEPLQRAQELYARHAQAICDDELEKWPELFTENCQYKIISRVNYDRNLPLSVIFAESQGALKDRVIAIRNTMVYAPRYMSHLVTGVRIIETLADSLKSRSQFAIYHTLSDGNAQLHLIGRTFDQIDTSAADWKFSQRTVVFDNELVPGSVVYPA